MESRQDISVLIVSADEAIIQRVGGALRHWQPRLVVADGYVSAFKLLAARPFDFVFADTRNAEIPLKDLFARLNYRRPAAEIIGLNDPISGESPASPFDYGCAALLPAETDSEELQHLVADILTRRTEVQTCGWIGKSPAIRSAASLVLTAAPTNATVLLIGESGTGKELAAHALHENSPRKNKPFVAVNCSALSEGILESELFGHEKGAFTDAFAQKQGVFESAHGGTIFLDEIGDMPPGLQAKVLRVLEDRRVRRVGGTITLDIDIRVIAATNHDLAVAVEDGAFRGDLYFRLSVIRLNLPRLYDRLWDIPLLAETFAAATSQAKPLSFADDAYERMLAYHWPGNVRELKNFVERLGVLSPTGRIGAKTVRKYLQEQQPLNRNLPVVTGLSPETSRHDLILAALAELKRDLTRIKQAMGLVPGQPVYHHSETATTINDEKPQNLKHIEIETIREALKTVNGNRRRAAKLLGIGERTLYRKIKEYGL